jgi:hypothetical protein
MNMALGQWIARLANQRIDQYGETSQEALTRAQEWVDIREGAYRALGAPYGNDIDDLLRWLDERNPFAPAAEAKAARTAQPARDAHA